MSDYDNTDIVDNSAEFGVPIGVKVVLQQTSHDAPYAQLDSKTPFWFPQAKHYASVEVNSERVNFLGDTRASFRSGIVNPERSLLFYNDGAQIFYDRAQPYILEESIWHSEIMYQNEFRCDASTEWTWRWKPVKADVHIDEGCVIAQNSQSGIFFHWFFDVVSKIWLFQRHFPGSKSKFFCGSVTQSYKIATLSAFQISPEQIIEPPAGRSIVEFCNPHIPIFEFTEMRKTRFSRDRGIHHKGWPPEFVAELRDRMLHHFGIAAGPRDLKIYVSRQDAEYRKILNEQEVINYFAGLGYVIITPGFLTLRDQVELFSRAKLIVGCHGAGLTNILWAGIGATLIEFMPNGFDDASYRFLAPLCGCEYHCLICKSDEPEKWDDHKANLEVDMKDLQSLRHLW